MSGVWLIAGLGNPGRGYAKHRHNVGFLVADALAERLGAKFAGKRFRAEVAEARDGDSRLVIVKPQTYMNDSGEAVAPLAGYFKIQASNVLALCDDLELPIGKLRLRAKGGHGGHNGLRSIAERLGSTEFPRLRIGIGRPALEAELGRRDDLVTAHVLGAFSAEERPVIDAAIALAVAVVRSVVGDGVDPAQNVLARAPD